MPVTVNKSFHTLKDAGSAFSLLQTFTSRPVVTYGLDNPQALEREIIKMQTYLSTQSATNPPSNKKFDPAKINTSILDQELSAKLVELQVAANLT
jgi:hypothetical protein